MNSELKEYILELHSLTSKEFCDKYKIESPSWKGDVQLAAFEFIRLDAIKWKMVREFAKTVKDRTPSPSGGIRTAEYVLSKCTTEAMIGRRDNQNIPYYNHDEVLEAIHAYHNQFSGDGWISVKDRLPENRTWILAYTKGDEIEMSHYKHGVFYRDDTLSVIYNVTYWQALPQAPQNTKES